MKRENDKYQFKEPFGREIRRKMIESQKKACQGTDKFLKLGQLKPTVLATVGHMATGVIQPEKKPAQKAENKKSGEKKKPNGKGKKGKGKKRKGKNEDAPSETEDKPVEKKAKKQGESNPKAKKISSISLEEFDKIRNQFPRYEILFTNAPERELKIILSI